MGIFRARKQGDLTPKEQAQGGFTLLEVMVALAIVGIALTGITISMGDSHKTKARLEKLMAADIAARNLMDRFRTPYTIANVPRNESGEISMAGFELSYTQTAIPAAMKGLKKVDITIYDHDKKTKLRTLTMFAQDK